MEEERPKIAPHYKPRFNVNGSLNLIRLSRTSLRTKLKVLRSDTERVNPFRHRLSLMDPEKRAEHCKLSSLEFVQLYKCVQEKINLAMCSSNNTDAITEFLSRFWNRDAKWYEISTLPGLIKKVDSNYMANEVHKLIDLDRYESICSENKENYSNYMVNFYETIDSLADLLRDVELEIPFFNKINKTLKNTLDFRFSFKRNKNKIEKSKNFDKFWLKGRVHGIDENTRTILEIKAVGNNSKTIITDEDYLMCMANMNLFNCENCLFVEYAPNGLLQPTLFKYEHDVFEREVLSVCDEFVDFARRLDDEILFCMVAFQDD